MDARSYSCSMVNPALPNDPPKSFTFDGVYAEDSTTEQIYNDIGFALVEVILSIICSRGMVIITMVKQVKLNLETSVYLGTLLKLLSGLMRSK